MTADRRRYGVIEVRRRNAETYHLTIDGQMWSEVEWSHDRQAWCVQGAAGRCLAHVEHIVGQDGDLQTAIRLAKRMIVDGRMPLAGLARLISQTVTMNDLARDARPPTPAESRSARELNPRAQHGYATPDDVAATGKRLRKMPVDTSVLKQPM